MFSSWLRLALCWGNDASHPPSFAGVVHGAGSEAVAAAHRLREDVRDAAGRLGRQLFDRNSQRAFAPAVAFAAESVQVWHFVAHGVTMVSQRCTNAPRDTRKSWLHA